jgi:hypothetical protein
MFIHGHNEAAEELVDDVERQVEEQTGQRLEEVEGSIKIRQRRSIGFGVIAHTAFKALPQAQSRSSSGTCSGRCCSATCSTPSAAGP